MQRTRRHPFGIASWHSWPRHFALRLQTSNAYFCSCCKSQRLVEFAYLLFANRTAVVVIAMFTFRTAPLSSFCVRWLIDCLMVKRKQNQIILSIGVEALNSHARPELWILSSVDYGNHSIPNAKESVSAATAADGALAKHVPVRRTCSAESSCSSLLLRYWTSLAVGVEMHWTKQQGPKAESNLLSHPAREWIVVHDSL